MANATYKVSFTTGGLYEREAIKAAQLFLELKDWQTVRRKILEGNLFQTRTIASAGRILRELLPRISLLTEEQLYILVHRNRQEQKQILWLAVCKQYPFIHEFAEEVIREKALRLEKQLSYLDYDAFFNAKVEWHEELEKLTPRTRTELRRVLFHMLREAEILSDHDEIRPFLLFPNVVQSIVSDDVSFITIFPVSESDFRRQVAL